MNEPHTPDAELARALAELGELEYAVSHDVRAPLRAVLHNLELLQRRSGDELNDVGKDHLERALDGTRRCHAMIEELLVYARLKTKAAPAEQVDCEQLVARLRRELAEQLEARQATLVAAPLPRLVGERQQLLLLFRHLIRNALQYAGEAPQIRLACERRDGHFLFTVSDDGPGFPAADTARALHLFTSLHEPAERHGNGMGLAICKRIVELHGGTLTLANGSPGGAIITFTLPVPSGEDTAAAAAPKVRIIRP